MKFSVLLSAALAAETVFASSWFSKAGEFKLRTCFIIWRPTQVLLKSHLPCPASKIQKIEILRQS